MPLPPPSHQLKADDARAVESELFDSEVIRLAVKNHYAALLSTRLLHYHHPKAARFMRIHSFCELRLLENSTIHPSLSHPAKCGFQTPVLDVLDVERAKLYPFLRLPSDSPPLPGTPLCWDAHPLPLENIFSISIRLPAVPSHRPAPLPLMPLRPRRLAGMRARPPFRYVLCPYPP